MRPSFYYIQLYAKEATVEPPYKEPPYKGHCYSGQYPLVFCILFDFETKETSVIRTNPVVQAFLIREVPLYVSHTVQ